MKNNDRKARIEAMKREIERRGGVFGVSSSIPEDVLEGFLQQILDCPDCRAAADDPFAPRRRESHNH